MANIKITDLTAYTNPDSTDVLPIVDVGADVTKKVSIGDLLKNASAGTAAAPGIAFDGDNAGLYSPGPDQVAISTNGTQRLLIRSNGQVGVGTYPNSYSTFPTNPFQINPGAPGGAYIAFNQASGDTYIEEQRWTGSGGNFRANRILTNSAGDLVFQGAPAAALGSQSFTERMRLDSNGRLGLGTSSPGQLLHLGGQINPTIRINTIKGDDNWSTTASYGGVEFFSPDFEYDGNGEMASIRVGVGTVFGKNPSLRFSVSAPSGGVANPQERMRIDHLGRVGIGDTEPSETLTVKGVSSVDPLSVSGPSSEFLRVDDSGRLLVGTSSQSGGSLLQVNDDRIRIASSKTPASASDTGTAGEICWDSSYIYVCTATNTWKRAALSTW